MGIQKNAGQIFHLLYDKYSKNEKINPEILLEETKLEGNDADKAIKYLKDRDLIEIILTLGNIKGLQYFIFKKITPEGIKIAENDKNFIEEFGINPKEIKF